MNASTLLPHFQRLGRRIGIVKSAILRDRNCVHLFPAVLALTWAADCAHSCEIVREKFDASVKELRSDGRLIVTSAGQDVALLLYDYDLPKKGDIGFAALRKALSVATSTPIACEVQKNTRTTLMQFAWSRGEYRWQWSLNNGV